MLKGRPLKTRLKCMLLLFSLLPCCGLGLLLSGMSWKSYLKNVGKENQAVLTALRNDVRIMEAQAESLVNTLASDSAVLSLLSPSRSNDAQQHREAGNDDHAGLPFRFRREFRTDLSG